jgi:site-specific recombinase XerD
MGRKTFRKIITSPELIEQINTENSKLATAFLKEKATRSSAMTINSYRCDLNLFFVWNVLNNENKLFTDIKKLELASFFSFAVDELKWGSSRLNRLRSTLSSFSIFIEKFMDDSYPNFSNIVLKTIESTPKNQRREKTILSNEQVESALAYFKENDSQIACWLALGAFSGSRFSELLRFDVSIIDYNHVAFGDLFLETTRQVRSKGRGRDGKLLYKYILRERFWQYYSKWIKDRKLILENKNQSHDMLFIKTDGSPANDGTVHSWITQIEEFLKVPFYAHSLRHFLVTEFSRKNIPPQLIQALVGWESLSMVTLYCDLEAKNQKWVELENLR